MAKAPRNMGASVRARLLNLARERGQVFDLLLTRYALERLLYRLSISTYRNQFVLKGAMLVTTWFDDPHRPTRDLDLLGFGDSSSETMLTVWKNICETALDDGIKFDGDARRSDPRTIRVRRSTASDDSRTGKRKNYHHRRYRFR
jgi:predicted nucleotidyltransferase component of viral defense system